MYKFQKANIDEIEQNANSYKDRLIFQTKEWISFIEKTKNVMPVLLKIYKEKQHIGYFTGFLFSKFGLKILGSPFRGWTTLYMGFNIKDDIKIDRAELIKPLWQYIKKEYHCVYGEIIDRFITQKEVEKYNLTYSLQGSYEINLNKTEEDLFKSFTKHCREHIRLFERNPIQVQEVKPDLQFAKLYYEQIQRVFGYQNLIPSYDLNRVKVLFECLQNTDRLYCLKVLDPTGKPIACAISFGFKQYCYTWGSTSMREGKDYRQSEGIRWQLIKYWHNKGFTSIDLVGRRPYKLKFNPIELDIPRIILSKYKFLIWGRNLAEKLYWKINKLKGILKK